jgi:hypothetical protein
MSSGRCGPARYDARLAQVDLVLRALFAAVIRPVGVFVRRRDPLVLRRPESSNWRPFQG